MILVMVKIVLFTHLVNLNGMIHHVKMINTSLFVNVMVATPLLENYKKLMFMKKLNLSLYEMIHAVLTIVKG